ncbi:hypothetical protein WICPIJ_009655 [Wickerhamomyces pijperi]|uniref:Proteasome assembly chaperone 4 n=1 Tax=Wickerhamomyces pijperi TaxID=599730 RepID=A0A9P8TCS5_WICPI|nr:hypothetical protein WICPIJ_009655 [Wickerhamomyces pijperi]
MPIESQYTTTIQTTIPSDFTDQYHILLTLPKIKPTSTTKSRIPITLFVSDTAQDPTFTSYTYTIPDRVRGDIYQTILNNSSEEILESNKKMSRIICKKFDIPVYLSLNCQIDGFETVRVIKNVLDLIEGSFAKKEVADQ